MVALLWLSRIECKMIDGIPVETLFAGCSTYFPSRDCNFPDS